MLFAVKLGPYGLWEADQAADEFSTIVRVVRFELIFCPTNLRRMPGYKNVVAVQPKASKPEVRDAVLPVR